MKKTILALMVGFLVGCGGGDSSNGGEETVGQNQGGTPTSSSWDPETSNFTCDPDKFTYSNLSIDVRYAAEGSIKVECIENMGYTSPKYSLIDTDSIEVVEYTKVETIVGTSKKHGNFSTTDTYDFKTGKHYIKGNADSGLSIDCVETYSSPFPMTFEKNGLRDLTELISFDEDDFDTRISTTCPASYYVDDDSDDGDDISSAGTKRTDIVITDSAGNISKVSTEEVYSPK